MASGLHFNVTTKWLPPVQTLLEVLYAGWYWTQTNIILEEKTTSIEKMPSPDWAVNQPVYSFLINDVRGLSPLWVGPPLGRWSVIP